VLSLPSCFRGIRDYGNDYIVGFDEFLERVEDGEKHLIDEEEVLWTTYLISAEFEYECENFDKAEKIIRRIMPLVEERHYTYLYFVCTAVLVKITRARNRGEIDSLTSRLEVIIQKNGHQYLLPNFHAFEMRNKIACGQVGFSDSFLNENMAITDTPYLHLLYRHITYVRGLLSSGRYSEALIILGNLEITCKKYSRPTDLLEISVLMSIAYFKLGQHNIACDIMLSTLESAKRYGYIRIFADDATEVVPILLLMQKQIEDKYTRKVINSCKKSFARSKNKIIDYEQPYTELTKTEHKILKYLQTGMSYAEIALENSINISTVKSHAHSIYSKLAVSNRTSAVLLAQKMGILN
jgi:LuxR family maltose regulon positive regulatory protein